MVMGLGLSSCATSGYLADRNNDLKDVFTVEVGYGLGARVRAGSMHVGLAGAVSTLGLSNGEFFQCSYSITSSTMDNLTLATSSFRSTVI